MASEMQTVNEYRAMIIHNDRKMHDDLSQLYKDGSLTDLFRKMNSYMHLIKIPWDEMRKREDAPADGNRWLPLFHDLILWLEDITETDLVLSANEDCRLNWSWNKKDHQEQIMKWYRKNTPLEFLKNIQKEWRASWVATGCEIPEHYIPMMTVLLKRCKDLARAQDYAASIPESPLSIGTRAHQAVEDRVEKAGGGIHSLGSAFAIDQYYDDQRDRKFKAFREGIPIQDDNRLPWPTMLDNPKEETTMNPIKVEERTFIGNTDAKDMSDELIFIDIGNLEAEARVLSALKTKSTKLNKRIKALRKSARKLAAYVDAR